MTQRHATTYLGACLKGQLVRILEAPELGTVEVVYPWRDADDDVVFCRTARAPGGTFLPADVRVVVAD